MHGVRGVILALCFSAPFNALSGSEPAPSPTPALMGESAPELLLQQGKPDEAVVRFRTLLAARPGDYASLVGLSKALALTGRREEALALLDVERVRERSRARKSALQRRQDVLAHLFLTTATQQLYFEATTLLLNRRYADARARLDQAIQAEPAQADLLFRQGQAALLMGDADTAVEFLRQAQRFAVARDAESLWLGRALDLKGESVAAREILEKLWRKPSKKGGDGRSLTALWWSDFLTRAGKSAAAREVLDRALRLDPGELRLWSARTALELDSGAALTGRPSGGIEKLAAHLETLLSEGPSGVRVPLKDAAVGLFPESDDRARAAAFEILEKIRSRLPERDAPGAVRPGPK